MPVSAGEALAAALLARAGEGARLVARAARPWASATFEGEVHRLELAMPAGAAAAFAEGLGEADFPLRRCFVADIAIEQGHEQGEARILAVEALVIAEA